MCLDLVVSGVDNVSMELAESALWGDSVTASDPYPSDPGLGAPICAAMSGGYCIASASFSDGVIHLWARRGRVLSEYATWSSGQMTFRSAESSR